MGKFTKSKNSSLKINGVKFHQMYLDLLKTEHEVKPLYGSEIAMFMISLFYCDDFGRIHLKGNESLMKFGEDRTGIPYNTLYTGFQRLLERKLISEEIESGMPVYVIKDYDILNSYRGDKSAALENVLHVPHSNSAMNYFYLPEWVLDSPSKPLKQLVTAKDVQGLLVLLDVFNAFSRDLRFREEAGQCKIKRKMSWLKDRLKRNAKKVRTWVERVAGVFSSTPAEQKERHPNQERLGSRKKNNPIQIVIDAFDFSLDENCLYHEKEDAEIVRLRAAIRKDITYQLRDLMIDYKVTQQDRHDLAYVFNQVAIDTLASAPISPSDRKWYALHILRESLSGIETYYQESKARNKSFKIKSLGALFRSVVTEKVKYTVRHELDAFSRESLIAKVKEHQDQFPAVYKMLFPTT